MKRRHYILLLGGTSAGALSIGTGAFSSAQAERGVTVNVADDNNAFVRYEVKDRTVSSDDERVELVTVTNQLSETIEIVEVMIVEGSDVLSDVACTNSELSPGDTATISAAHGIAPGESVDVGVTVTAEGSGVTTQLFGDTRLFTITHEE